MVNLGNSWDEILKDEFEKEYYLKIRKFLVYEYNHYRIFPNMNDIFNALKMADYSDIKVVIIGQDPYHEDGQAHGCRPGTVHSHRQRGAESGRNNQKTLAYIRPELGILLQLQQQAEPVPEAEQHTAPPLRAVVLLRGERHQRLSGTHIFILKS